MVADKASESRCLGAAILVPNERSSVFRNGVCDWRRPLLPPKSRGAADARRLQRVAHPFLRSRNRLRPRLSPLEQHRLSRSQGLSRMQSLFLTATTDQPQHSTRSHFAVYPSFGITLDRSELRHCYVFLEDSGGVF